MNRCKRCGVNRPMCSRLKNEPSVLHFYYTGSGNFVEEHKTYLHEVKYDNYCWYCARQIEKEKAEKKRLAKEAQKIKKVKTINGEVWT